MNNLLARSLPIAAVALLSATIHASVVFPELPHPEETLLLETQRGPATITPMTDGRLLVAGGVGLRNDVTAYVETVDQGGGRTPSQPMTAARALHAAVLLGDGRVMVAGGQGPGKKLLASVEIYEPAAGTWTPASPMNEPREGHSATLLVSGKVVVAGGYGDSATGLRSVEIYDPDTDRWTNAAAMNYGRFLHTGTRLASGRLLVAGGGTIAGAHGIHGTPTVRKTIASVEIYDPGRNRWTLSPETIEPREGHTSTLLTSGAVRLAGGYSLVSPEIPIAPESIDPPAVIAEFHNARLDTYFITASAPEQLTVAGGGAGPDWVYTGETFNAGGAQPVCRFYGSVAPGPNSHFYTIDAGECDGLVNRAVRAEPGTPRWNFESLDFESTRADAGECPAGTEPVYRAYNNGAARGIDSNHRIVASRWAYQAQLAQGWKGEGVVMCAPL